VVTTVGGDRDAPTGAHPAPDASPRRARRTTWVVAAVTALAGGLLLFRIGSRALWFDEGFTVGLVRLPYGELLGRLWRWEVNQSPYYLLFDLWHGVVGEGEAAMRLFSALFAVATVPVLFLLGRRLADERVGLVAALLFALNAMVVQWGQQLRAYSMVLFLVTLATFLLVRAVDRPTTGRALAYALVATLAVYANFFALLVVGVHWLTLAVVRPFPRRTAVVTGLVMVVPVVRIVVFVLTASVDPLGWIERPGGRRLVSDLADLAGGGAEQLAVYAVVAGAGVVLALGAAGRLPRSTAWWRLVLPVAWLVLPVAGVLASTYTAKPLLVPRYLIVVVPALALVAAHALVHLADRRLAAAGGVALVAVSVLGLVTWYTTPSKEDWPSAVEQVLEGRRPGDALVVVPFTAEPTVAFELRKRGVDDLDLLAPAASDPPTDGRVWELRRRVSGERPIEVPWDPLAGYADWLDRHYTTVSERSFRGGTVSLHEPGAG
jgi:mannosyltransferase